MPIIFTLIEEFSLDEVKKIRDDAFATNHLEILSMCDYRIACERLYAARQHAMEAKIMADEYYKIVRESQFQMMEAHGLFSTFDDDHLIKYDGVTDLTVTYEELLERGKAQREEIERAEAAKKSIKEAEIKANVEIGEVTFVKSNNYTVIESANMAKAREAANKFIDGVAGHAKVAEIVAAFQMHCVNVAEAKYAAKRGATVSYTTDTEYGYAAVTDDEDSVKYVVTTNVAVEGKKTVEKGVVIVGKLSDVIEYDNKTSRVTMDVYGSKYHVHDYSGVYACDECFERMSVYLEHIGVHAMKLRDDHARLIYIAYATHYVRELAAKFSAHRHMPSNNTQIVTRMIT